MSTASSQPVPYTESFHKIEVPGGIVEARLVMPEDAAAREKLPLIGVHGGPGSTHDGMAHFLMPLAADRPVIFYDQLGSARSPSPITPNLTRLSRFVAELRAVQQHFGYAATAILGQSWGGSIVADFALDYPAHTAALVLSSPLLSTRRWLSDAQVLLQEIPQEMREVLLAGDRGESVDQEAYDAAEQFFYSRHVCRLDPRPPALEAARHKSNPALYNVMWGRSEFVCTGTLQSYDRWPDLPEIKARTLIICGEHDEARPESMAEAAQLIPDAALAVIPNASHIPWAENQDVYLKTLSDFLNSAG